MSANPRARLPNSNHVLDIQTLKPVLRAYGWALLSVTAPRILSLLLAVLQRKKKSLDALKQTYDTFKRQIAFDKLPTSFAILVSGAVLLPQSLAALFGVSPIKTSTNKLCWGSNRWHGLRFVCTFVTGLISFKLLNRRRLNPETLTADGFAEADASNSPHTLNVSSSTIAPDSKVIMARSVPLAGRTLDLTFFGMVRATDICLRSLWSYYIPPRKSTSKRLRAARVVDRVTGPLTFIASSSIIMWAWFYSPNTLPKPYRAWISSVAQLDTHLLTALRACRAGTFVYGKETGAGAILKPMCHDLGYPESWGNPAECPQGIPCKLGHCGMGENCEWHALQRLAQAWLFAFKMYLPLNMLIFTRRKPTARTAAKMLREVGRSSAFLGAFVALFYYGVCLTRRRVGPRILPGVTWQQWDGGYSVGVGCLLCGTSILLEKRSRRQEIAFFVAPRALATAFPRRYDRKYIWREQLAYATCAAIILTSAVESPKRVRGVFGRLLGQILA